MGYLIAFVVAVVLFVGAFNIWQISERHDLERCQEKYGTEYKLGHSRVNSSIKWCVSPDGVMKEL